MPQGNILPEGSLLGTPEMTYLTGAAEGIERAWRTGAVLEGTAVRCDAAHDLFIRMGKYTVRIPREEAAVGISEGTVRDIAILARVGKPVCFRLEDISALRVPGGVLTGSRRAVQTQAMDALLKNLLPGEIIRARVTHLEPFGCFVDIGQGCVSMIGADRISVSRIRHSNERFRSGQEIRALVTEIDKHGRRILLSHKELLGTWEENAKLFKAGETVRGIVRGIEEYGVFIELTPNLSGLAEPVPGLREGECVSVYIKSIRPDKMKIKLLIIDRVGEDAPFIQLKYFRSEGRMQSFSYAPPGYGRNDEKIVFSAVGCAACRDNGTML